jgi:hypothetical protein
MTAVARPMLLVQVRVGRTVRNLRVLDTVASADGSTISN